MSTTSTFAWDQNSLAPAVLRVFGDFRFHTDGDLLALKFTADGSLLSVEEPGVLRRWDPATGQQRGWHFLSDLETLWAFSGDGRFLASASDDLSLWDATAGTLLTAVPQPSWVTAVTFRADPSYVATGHDDGTVRVWHLPSHDAVGEFTGPDAPVSALAFSPDGNRLAAAAEDKVIYVWDVPGGKLLGKLTGHTDRVHALAWHPQGNRLVSAGWDTTARVWDTATFEPVILLNSHATQVTALAFSPDGALLACADSGDAVHVWDFAASKERQILKGHSDLIHSLAFRGDGQRLASGGADRVIHLWDLTQPQPTQSRATEEHSPDLAGPRRTGSSVAVSRDGKRLASTSGGAGLQVWDVPSSQPIFSAEGFSPVHAVAGSPDGRWLAAGGSDARIRVWEKPGGPPARVLEDEDHTDPVTTLAFSPDSELLASASASDTAVWLWRLADGEPVLLIPDAIDGCTIESVAFHPAGRLLAAGGIDWLATGGSDGAVAVWDVKDRCEVALFDGGTTAVAFHPSGRWLASASLANSVCVWDMESRELVTELTGPEDAVTSVAYSPDGRWLAAGSDDRTLRLWDAATFKLAAETSLDTQIKSLAFSPDGRFLFTGNGNTTGYQLDVERLLGAGPLA